MGCHAGLNVPDGSVADTRWRRRISTRFRTGVCPTRRSRLIANAGFGYGMDDAVANSEQLMLFLTQEMGTQTTVPIGQALIAAKQRYVGSAPSASFSSYDEKSLIEATLYGLPMLKVSMPMTQPIGAGGITSSESAPVPSGDLIGTRIDAQLNPIGHTTANGTYFSLGGEVQASPGRPVQPRGTIAISKTTGFSPRGLLLLSATYSYIQLRSCHHRLVTDVTLLEQGFNARGWFRPSSGPITASARIPSCW
jgi:hypothetical protein